MKVECLPHAFQMSPTRKRLAAALGLITLQVKIVEQQSLEVGWGVSCLSWWDPFLLIRRLSCWPSLRKTHWKHFSWTDWRVSQDQLHNSVGAN